MYACKFLTGYTPLFMAKLRGGTVVHPSFGNSFNELELGVDSTRTTATMNPAVSTGRSLVLGVSFKFISL